MTPDRTRRNVIVASGAAIATGLSGCLSGGRTDASDDDDVSLAVAEAHQYSSPGCSCCSQYATYLDERVDGAVTETTSNDIAAVKRQHGVPDELKSCHTLTVGEYVVEGHVPAPVIATLLEDEPAIDGIALPGMPTGSPGMGGSKRGAFAIHKFDDGQAIGVYAEY